jgi:hypothetical protein
MRFGITDIFIFKLILTTLKNGDKSINGIYSHEGIRNVARNLQYVVFIQWQIVFFFNFSFQWACNKKVWQLICELILHVKRLLWRIIFETLFFRLLRGAEWALKKRRKCKICRMIIQTLCPKYYRPHTSCILYSPYIIVSIFFFENKYWFGACFEGFSVYFIFLSGVIDAAYTKQDLPYT